MLFKSPQLTLRVVWGREHGRSIPFTSTLERPHNGRFRGKAEMDDRAAQPETDVNDPNETLLVHCANWFGPYQSSCFSGCD